MEAIHLSELQAAKNFSTFNDLSNDIRESTNMQSLLNNFVAESHGKLNGKMWDAISTELNQFSEVLNERIKLASNLSSAIQSAFNMLVDYFGDEYSSLYFLEFLDLLSCRDRCNQNISNTNATLNSLKKLKQNGDDSVDKDIRYYSGLLTSYQDELDKANKLIDKLEGLKAVYAEAEGILQAAFAEVNTVGKTISNINVGGTVSFVQ